MIVGTDRRLARLAEKLVTYLHLVVNTLRLVGAEELVLYFETLAFTCYLRRSGEGVLCRIVVLLGNIYAEKVGIVLL